MVGLELKYFVLKPKAKGERDWYAWASRAAMRRYATCIKPVNPQLADDLEAWADKESMTQDWSLSDLEDWVKGK